MSTKKSLKRSFENETLFQDMTFLSSDNYDKELNSNIFERIVDLIFPNKKSLKTQPVYIKSNSNNNLF